MKIIKLEAENIKGLKAVEITPEGNFVEISGKNGAGKSSVLDAIWLALGGNAAIKDVSSPLRNGTEDGFVDLDLGSLKVRKVYTAGRPDKLIVKAVHDGIESTVSRGQTTLDALRAITLDPGGFIALSAKEQRESLLGLLDLDIDLTKWESERVDLFDQRTSIGQQGKALGDVGAIEADLPTEEQAASDLIAQIQRANEHNAQHASRVQAAFTSGIAVERLTEQIAELQEQLAAQIDMGKIATEWLKTHALQDTDVLTADLAKVEETNAAIRANNERKAQAARKAELTSAYDAKTDALKLHDAKKAAAFAKAKVPLDGLTVEADHIALNGVAFQDVNSADQIEVALAILAGLNPRLRIVQIRHGSLLDQDSIARVKAFADTNDLQIWIETVGAGSEDAIIIEAGEVA